VRSETRVVHFKKEPYDVYIGRPSKWENPFASKPSSLAEHHVESKAAAIDAYRDYILSRPDLLADLAELEGKTLGCWCRPGRCHGDVLVELISQGIVQQLALDLRAS
jgi:hypothetical protein